MRRTSAIKCHKVTDLTSPVHGGVKGVTLWHLLGRECVREGSKGVQVSVGA
jgi:hypothetical protein